MRKIILGAIAASMALSFGTASAEAGNGCVVQPGYQAQGLCTYTADGPGTLFLATPNAVKVTAVRVVDGVDTTVSLWSNGTADPAAQGQRALATLAGDKVTVTVGEDANGDCVDDAYVCGTVGLIAAVEGA